MSFTERVWVALRAGCAVSVDVKKHPPDDLIAFVQYAAAKSLKITFKNAFEKDPTTMTTIATLGGAHVTLDF